MNKKLIEYIREKEQCSYTDVADFYRDLQHHTYEQAFSAVMDVLSYVEHEEQMQDIEDTVLEVEDMKFK